jgi:hypothetical protein
MQPRNEEFFPFQRSQLGHQAQILKEYPARLPF